MKYLRSLAAATTCALVLLAAPLEARSRPASTKARVVTATAAPRARNVILFLADAAGVSVLNGASIMAYGEPLKLRVQQWPNLGLSETSPVDEYVSDSANGMSAIVTGVKTRNGVISQTGDAVRGKVDGAPTKTLLEYAEERGLLTGVVTDKPITDATPAANYAHANDRRKWGEIFLQAFAPRYGDGVDVLIGSGREPIAEQLATQGSSFATLARTHGRPIFETLGAVPPTEQRPVVVADKIDVRAATLKTLETLQRGPKGYFLAVEWDAHTDDPREGMQNVADFDRLIAEVEKRVDLRDTLLIFTADHSFGLQIDGGRRGAALMEGYDTWKASKSESDTIRLKNVFVNATHTAEEVPVLATGAGAAAVRGYFPNTHLFKVMMDAWGWVADATR